MSRIMVLWTVAILTLWAQPTSKLDEKSGLVWQDNADVGEISKSYDEAKAYCDGLVLDGFDDWRLPTIYELFTIVDLSRDRPALKAGFAVRSDDWFWTATPFADAPKKEAWYISMRYGEAEHSRKDRALAVRCVRGGKR